MTNATSLPSVAVIGLGYIGLPTAAVFAQAGLTVRGVDVDENRVRMINDGIVPFVEEGLGTVLAGVVARGRFSASTQTPEADAYVVAVPTPFEADHTANLSYIEDASRKLGARLRGGELVVLESTSPPGTTERMAEMILRERPDLSSDPAEERCVYFAHAPERVLPSRIMVEMIENDRIIGGINAESTERAVELYSYFVTGDILRTDARTAELAKLTENSFRDVNIAFANEISLIAERQGVDVWELIDLANHHPRVNILQPGPGVGGHCIAVDPWFIISAERETAQLIACARAVNDSKPEHVISKALNSISAVSHPVIAVLGITFKANIDDIRESPSSTIARELAVRAPAAQVLVVEPNIERLPDGLGSLDNVVQCELGEAIQRADLVLLLVDHEEFASVDPATLQRKTVIDTKGIWR